jgi:4-cresol dehydrogenase (hydroxylating) flavoprotein subunit
MLLRRLLNVGRDHRHMRKHHLNSALAEWTEAIGAEHVVVDSVERRLAETATFRTDQQIPVILKPANRLQVTEVVKIAARNGFPLYPISSGKNWGYGSRVPVQCQCALLDLSRMNEITGFDEDLGCVTVEPGVTQQALFNFLRNRNSGLWMDATGSSPDCSLIGNAMERGFGHTPYGDHFANVCGLEVVLASGDVIQTGFAGMPSAKAGQVYRWGCGPSLDGLFSQSNLGIVVGMTVWLMPAPAYFQAFFFTSNDEKCLPAVVEALRPLRMNGTLRSSVHIGNDYKVLAGVRQFPWGEQSPLSPEQMRGLGKKWKFARWSGSGALYGTRGQVAEARRLVRKALKGKTDKMQFLDDRVLSLATRFQGLYKLFTGIDLSRTLQLLRPVYGLLKGIPTRDALGSAYWRKRMSVPADPDLDRDGCGLLWTAPVAPMEGAAAVELVRVAERILLDHGFEPQISLTLLTERALACVISIAYDRELPGEDAKALACYAALRDRLERDGYYSYRLGIAGMRVMAAVPAYADLLRTLKQALDPRDILAPGRYIPASEIGANSPSYVAAHG